MTDFDERPSLVLSRLTFATALLCVVPLYLVVVARSLAHDSSGFVSSSLLCGFFVVPTFLAGCLLLRPGVGQLSRVGYLAGVMACLGPGVVFASFISELMSTPTALRLPVLDRLFLHVFGIAALMICSIGALRFEQWFRRRERPVVEEKRMLQRAGFVLLLVAAVGIQNEDLLRSMNDTLFFGLLLPVALVLLSGNRIAQTLVLCGAAFVAFLATIPVCAEAGITLLGGDTDRLGFTTMIALSLALWGAASACLSLAFHPEESAGGTMIATSKRSETLWTSWHV